MTQHQATTPVRLTEEQIEQFFARATSRSTGCFQHPHPEADAGLQRLTVEPAVLQVARDIRAWLTTGPL